MSTKKLPTISVTSEQQQHVSESSDDDDDSYSNDMDYNQNAGDVTDIEDMESQAGDAPRSRSSSFVNGLYVPKKLAKDNDVTDIEDYNDSDSDADEEKSNVYPELKMSLQEFLQHDLQEQAIVNNEMNEKIEILAGNFLQAQNLNGINDYLTDCEDYNTDSDIEDGYEKSVCVDLNAAFDGQGTICVADGSKAGRGNEEDSDEYDDVSVLSDVSDMVAALSDITGVAAERGMSEDEMMEISGDEEVCQFSDSSSDSASDIYDGASNANVPPIDVTFVGANGKLRRNSTAAMGSRTNFLEIASAHEEVLTDIEKLDDSAAEDDEFESEDENEEPIPHAVLATNDEGFCQTDTEWIPCDEETTHCEQDASNIPTVAENLLPPPHREVVMLKEDKYGDTITNVMPMDAEFQFGIYHNFRDEVATDSENYSCDEDYEPKSAIMSELLSPSNFIESEVTISNEIYKPMQNKRLEAHANVEQVTDVEEIYVAGTNRRKKLKTRSMSKGKPKCLEVVKGQEDAVTDVEDMELSDCGLPPNVKRSLLNKQKQDGQQQNSASIGTTEKVTDVEDLTADDNSDVSEAEALQIDMNSCNLQEYVYNSANFVVTLETDGAKCCPKYMNKSKLKQPHKLQQLKDEANQQQNVTDVEDMQLPSDADDDNNTSSNAGQEANESQCSCNHLNEMLNESYTVVHEKSGSSFNMQAEKLHIKDMCGLRDAHTDVEYVESDESAARGSN